jgi:murein DD-endopeptidase MepM/ murein hydrolase activator NlpD
MGKRRPALGGIVHAAAALALVGLLAACASDQSEPAPVILKGAESPLPGGALPAGESRQIVVRPGQSLRGIAHAYHVPASAIIAANHLRPPYTIAAGQNLLIPAGGAAPVQRAALAPPPAPPHAAGHPPPDIIPLDGPAPPRAITFPPPPPSAPASSAPAAAAARSPGAATLTSPSAAASAAKPAPAPDASEDARADPSASTAAPLPHGAHFPWPVRGHVLAGYGVAASGAHNDGINIAAPKGAPVAAVDGGVVAYAGNELRGYGNLVLVKHANGWISAYAHCEELLVKKGDKVGPGQVIAKVGATGGVNQPQLHFELRRGKKAVDPREFLAPAPSAAGSNSAVSGRMG